MKKLVKNFLLLLAIFLIITAIFSFFAEQGKESTVVGISTLVTRINQEEVEKIEVRGDKVIATLKEGGEEIVRKEPGESLSSLLSNFEVSPEKMTDLEIRVEEKSGWDYFLANILPFLLPFILISAFIIFMMRGIQGSNSRAMSFGQSKAKDFKPEGKKKPTFKDVAGAKEAKEELEEVVEFLRVPKKFHNLGAKIPRGVLLLGSPGTGKTLLARSVAGEAGVPFFHMSGSEFVEMFVGVGASRVRSLFEKAKKSSPCIIFIDEIDAVGRRRGAGLGGSHDEREQTLNQILVEMDGFEETHNVIVIAATNRPDVLDPALLRPGRFDRRVMIDMPDLEDRVAILKVHAKEKPLAENVNLRRVAQRTSGFSGADLANVLNEGAILSARENRKEILDKDLFEAIEKVMIGPERKSRVISEKEKKITAYHEAGHAIVSHFIPEADPVHKVSIISRGAAGGYTLKAPIEDKRMQSKSDFMADVAVLLAGHLVEKEIFNEVTTGASSDLRRATAIAKKLVTDYGMSEDLGPRTYGEKDEMIFLGKEIHEQKDYSEKVAEKIDEEITKVINLGIKRAKGIIENKKVELEKIVKALLEKETLEKDEFETILGEKPKTEDNKKEEENKEDSSDNNKDRENQDQKS